MRNRPQTNLKINCAAALKHKRQNRGQDLHWEASPETSPNSDRNLSEKMNQETKTFIHDLELGNGQSKSTPSPQHHRNPNLKPFL